MRERSRVKQIVFRLCAILLAIIAAEVGLRVYDVASGRSVRTRGIWYWAFEQDRFLGYQHRPNIDITLSSGTHMDPNSEGFRDVEIPIRADGRRLVICIGESSTWGLGAKNRTLTWPKKLEHILQESDPDFVVLNAALPGYTMVENLQLTQLRLLKYKPEAIVCMGMRNDFRAYAGCLEDDIDFNNYRRIFAELPKTPGNELLMRSSLVTMAATPFRGKFEGNAFFPTSLLSRCTRRGESLFRDQVALLSELCRRHEIRLLFVDQPIDYRDELALKLRPGFEHLRQVLHDELKKQNVTLLEADSKYNYSEFPLTDDVHFTAEGIDYLAGLLAPQILEQLGQ